MVSTRYETPHDHKQIHLLIENHVLSQRVHNPGHEHDPLGLLHAFSMAPVRCTVFTEVAHGNTSYCGWAMGYISRDIRPNGFGKCNIWE